MLKPVAVYCCNTDCRAAIQRPLLHCAKCREVVYCNRQCQQAHWRIHKIECADLPHSVVILSKFKPVRARVRVTTASSPAAVLSAPCGMCGSANGINSCNEFGVTCSECAMKTLLRDPMDDKCRRCSRRARNYPEIPVDEFLCVLTQICQVCINVEACGPGEQSRIAFITAKAHAEMLKVIGHVTGRTPPGAHVSLRELSMASLARELDAANCGRQLPLGPTGQIVSFDAASKAYTVLLDSGSGEVVQRHCSGVRLEGQLLDLPMDRSDWGQGR